MKDEQDRLQNEPRLQDKKDWLEDEWNRLQDKQDSLLDELDRSEKD